VPVASTASGIPRMASPKPMTVELFGNQRSAPANSGQGQRIRLRVARLRSRFSVSRRVTREARTRKTGGARLWFPRAPNVRQLRDEGVIIDAMSVAAHVDVRGAILI
jgi:hypothetical protein